MSNTTSPLLPQTEELLKRFGERLRLARLRRRLQAKQVAERAGMTEVTLRRVERGMSGVTIGAYLAVMQVLQLQDDIESWAVDDPLGRHLQDAQTHGGMRPRRARAALAAKPAPLTAVSAGQAASTPSRSGTSAPRTSAETPTSAEEPVRQGGISSSELLKMIKRSPKPGSGQT